LYIPPQHLKADDALYIGLGDLALLLVPAQQSDEHIGNCRQHKPKDGHHYYELD
jgi:hypothetical protein